MCCHLSIIQVGWGHYCRFAVTRQCLGASLPMRLALALARRRPRLLVLRAGLRLRPAAPSRRPHVLELWLVIAEAYIASQSNSSPLGTSTIRTPEPAAALAPTHTIAHSLVDLLLVLRHATLLATKTSAHPIAGSLVDLGLLDR